MNKKGVKVCTKQSIWTRNYQWTKAVNGATTSTAPALAPANKSPKAQKRIVDKLIESDEDDDEKLPTESENNDLMLNQYINPNAPSSKRFKDDESDERDVDCQPSTSKQITPNRNPFKKSSADSCVDPLLSPTRISKENNSLVKTQSPVKRYNYSRLEKLSKIGKRRGLTVVSNEQRVISRFFSADQKDVGAAAIAKADSGIQEDSDTKNDDSASAKAQQISAQLKSPSMLRKSSVAPHEALYFTKSFDSPMKSANMETAKNVDADVADDGECHRIALDQFKCVLKGKIEATEQDSNGLANLQGASDKTDDREINELPIVLSDTDDDSGFNCSGNVADKEPSNHTWFTSSQTKKSVSQNRLLFRWKMKKKTPKNVLFFTEYKANEGDRTTKKIHIKQQQIVHQNKLECVTAAPEHVWISDKVRIDL